MREEEEMFVRKKQRMTRLVILAILLTMLAWIPSVPQEAWAAETNENEVAYAVEGGNIYFNKETGTIVRADKEITQAEIPEEIEGVTVTNIDEFVFYACENLISVAVPKTVEVIGMQAFLAPGGIQEIKVDENNPNYATEDGVLFNKNKTKLIRYPSAKKGSTYIIPNTVTEIGFVALCCCDNLTSVTIPKTVEVIDNQALGIGSNIQEINVEEGNSRCSSEDGILFNKDKTTLIQYPSAKKGSTYSIPDTVKTIGKAAFNRCSNLTSITIPESVETIEMQAFLRSGLTSIFIPASVTNPDDIDFSRNKPFHECFAGCTNLINGVEIAEDNPVFSSQDGVIFNKDKTVLFCYPDALPAEEYTIPDGVTDITMRAFDHRCKVKTVHIPASVTTIETQAFSGWFFTEITVDERNEHYMSKDGALFSKDGTTLLRYYSCEDGSYTVPEGVTNIEEYAFLWTNKTTVIIPDHVENIHERAFNTDYRGTIKGSIGSAAETYAKAHNLNFVDINAEEPSQPSEPTTDPSESTEPTDESTPTEPTSPSVTPSEPSAEPTTPTEPPVTPTTPAPTEPVTKPTEPSVTPTEPSEAPTEPSADPENPTTPEQPSVTTPTEKPSAPVQTTKPGTIVQDTNSKATYVVTKTGNGASKNTVTYQKLKDTKKTAVIIPATVKIAGKTYQVTKIANNAFKNNSKVKTIKIGANIQTIGANAFNKCTKLTSITIPNKVTTIQKGAFANCKNLKSITIKTTKLTKKSVGKNAFKGIPAKTTIKVPKGKVKEYRKILQARGLSKNVKVK